MSLLSSLVKGRGPSFKQIQILLPKDFSEKFGWYWSNSSVKVINVFSLFRYLHLLFTQGCFLPCLCEIKLVVLEEKHFNPFSRRLYSLGYLRARLSLLWYFENPFSYQWHLSSIYMYISDSETWFWLFLSLVYVYGHVFI